jgi:hypothetical protein
MRQYRSVAATGARAAAWIKSAAFSVIISTQALMWAETKDRAWPWHGRRAALRHPDRASSGSPDDARSGNAAGDRGAARRLFSERGYFATKVDDIAALAR